jgi:hypothetical protein
MGRHIKNRELHTGSYAIRMPHSPSAAGPDAPVDGLVRYNETINKLQYYSLGAWRTFSAEGGALITKDTFVGDGSIRDFGPMSFAYEPNRESQMLVFIGNVFQNPGVAFQVFNDFIRFTSTPGDQQPIIVLHGYSSTVTTF